MRYSARRRIWSFTILLVLVLGDGSLQTRSTWPAISEHSFLRLFVVFILYIAQGLPYGLVFFAIPGWLATNDVSALAMGGYLSAAGLPWTIKFMHGFFMDRYAYLPMGRRRAWLIGAQTGMVLALLVCALINPQASQIGILSAFGFVLMLATTLQDVAVDGMAVDLLKEPERAKANGLMFGGQSIGIAAGGAFGGILMSSFSFPVALVSIGAAVALMLLMMLVLRERPGEKLLPWCEGQASAINVEYQQAGWLPILRKTFQVILTKRSLWLIIAMVLIYTCWGFFLGLTPLITSNVSGWTDAKYSSISGTANFASGVVSVLLLGLLVKKIGPRWGMLLSTSLFAAAALWMGFNEARWVDEMVMTIYIYFAITVVVLIVVCWATAAMRMCQPAVAATQFALYMAAPNLGSSIGAALLGPIEAIGGYQGVFVAMAAALLLGGVIFTIYGEPEQVPVELHPRVD